MNNIFKSVVFSTILAAASVVSAAPFARWTDEACPNGTTVHVYAEGDEYAVWYEVTDGHAVRYNTALGGYEYVRKQADGSLAGTGIAVGLEAGHEAEITAIPVHERDTSAAYAAEVEKRVLDKEEKMGIKAAWKQLKEDADLREKAAEMAKKGVRMTAPSSTTTGNIVGCTILVDFPTSEDGSGSLWSQANSSVTVAKVNTYLNGGAGETIWGNNSSIRQYYYEVSNGALNYSNVIIGPVKVPHPRAYYDTDEDESTCGPRLIKDVVAAMKLMSNFDSEIKPKLQTVSVISGNVRALNILYAGADPPSSKWGKGLWPHSYSCYVATGVSGVSFNKYQMSPCTTSPAMYVFCHENGHMVCGFDDFYNYGGDGAKSHKLVGTRCIMSARTSERNPMAVCGYLRYKAGWFTPKTITQNSEFTITRDYSDVYKYPNPNNSKEYYIIENRGGGRDSCINGSGIIIWHCNESGSNRRVTDWNPAFADAGDDSRYRMKGIELTMEQADGYYHMERDQSYDGLDFWYAGNTSARFGNEFSDSTLPTAKWMDGSLSNLRLNSFSALGATMTFQNGDPSLIGGPIGTLVGSSPSAYSTTVAVTLDTLGDNASSVSVVAEYVSNNKGTEVIATLPLGTMTSATSTSYVVPFPGSGNSFFLRLRFTNNKGRTSTTGIVSVTRGQGTGGGALAQAIDAPGLNVVTSGAGQWTVSSNEGQDGGSCAKYADSSKKQAKLEVTVTCPCSIRFYEKMVKSDNQAGGMFKLSRKTDNNGNYTDVSTFSDTSWSQKTISLTSYSGVQTFYFIGQRNDTKNGSKTVTFYVDKFEVVNSTQHLGTLAASIGVSNVSQTSAKVTLNVEDMGGESSVGAKTITVSANSDYSNPVYNGSASSTVTLSNLQPNTRYFVKGQVTGGSSAVYPAVGYFVTPDWTSPSGTVTASNLSYNSATVTATLTNNGSEAAGTVTVNVEVAMDEGFQEKIYDGVSPCNLQDLLPNTKYYMRATFTGLLATPGVATGNFTTPDYTAPTIGAVSGGSKSIDWTDVNVTVSDLGGGSSGVTILVQTTGNISATTNVTATGTYRLRLTGLSRKTSYPITVTVTATTGKYSTNNTCVIETMDGPEYQLSPSVSDVNDNGLSAVLSVNVPALNVIGTLELFLNGKSVKSWESGTGDFAFEVNVGRGTTNVYEFVAIGELAGEWVTNRVGGTFIARTYTDWFNVQFFDSGYVAGETWAADSVDASGGTWTTQTPTFTYLSSDPMRVLKFDDEHAESVKYTALKASEKNADTTITGTIAATTGSGMDVPSGAVGALKFVEASGEYVLPSVYVGGEWHTFGTGGFFEGTVVEYRFDFDYCSLEAPRLKLTVGAYTSDWYPFSIPEKKLTGVGFAGADVGDFRAWYWSMLQEPAPAAKKGVMLFLR